MGRIIQTIVTSFTIWVAASLINAILFTAWISLENMDGRYAAGRFGLALLCSMIFSIPAIFILWLFFIANYYESTLLQILLKTALVTSLVSGLFFWKVLAAKLLHHNYFVVLFIVASAIGAILLHAAKIKSIINNNQHENIL